MKEVRRLGRMQVCSLRERKERQGPALHVLAVREDVAIWTHLGAQVGGEEASRPLPSALCESHIGYRCA